MVNRSAVILRYKPPFIEWLREISEDHRDGSSLEDYNKNCLVYLVDAYDDEEFYESLIIEYDDFLIRELFHQEIDEKDWPQISFQLFQEWFSWEFYPIVEDFGTCDELIDE